MHKNVDCRQMNMCKNVAIKLVQMKRVLLVRYVKK